MPCPTARIACSDPQLATHLRRLFGDCEVIEDPRHCSQAPLCRWLDDAPLGPAGEVQAALAEAVATLERTRHAFRSPELGQLRRRLEQLLVELSAPTE
ncbi:hypothetical protein [Aquipseudomonas alcaligenes]|jgi:hypothetical protein|uniref:Uncharacterized protein n=2 Tax=Aquipseudomonas alcaligenes TaxID=43263 RepID=A0A2V4MHW3_AQUAC|nr:hypothetical protein [Pseudomonas alcaligenes]MDH0142956.1 hypothetical protein [Pseudomonas alcaligenes]PYC29626.1 hypothetical protein DMO17_01300 [Pseudomonas alcaligenes]